MTDEKASPKIGDLVAGPKDRVFTIREFPAKLGLKPGEAFEGVLVMTKEHEKVWEADTLHIAIQSHKAANNGKLPNKEAMAVLVEKSKLRPMPTLISRETGEPFQKPREMRFTGMVADLKQVTDNLWRLRTQAEFDAEQEAADVK